MSDLNPVYDRDGNELTVAPRYITLGYDNGHQLLGAMWSSLESAIISLEDILDHLRSLR